MTHSDLPVKIGPYKILKKIASGGMGEIFLAQDPLCDRHLALKRIRSDKILQSGIRERFLKEAKIAAQLSHPGIIPIYQIHVEQTDIYYTMPLVKGETLKEIIRTSLEQEKRGKIEHPIGSSIPSLIRIFLSICQAIAYSHSRGILHKDLKPDNIIIGPFGEVLILDWGLAGFVSQQGDSLPEQNREERDDGLTRPGKIAGTLSYLPPERMFGIKASYASDIYALGVILYQLLTLRMPFHRKSVREYKKQAKSESLIDPIERAPNRDIAPQLAKIAKKCLSKRPEKRYQTVEALITDLMNYIEGHAEWVPCASVHIEHKTDWRFQENILLAKHIALTKKSDIMEWVSLMVAKKDLPEKIKLETHIQIKEDGKGVGFLLNVHSSNDVKNLFQESFFLWIGSQIEPGCSLFRSNVELLSNPDLCLKNCLSHFIRIEKTSRRIRLYIDDLLALDYLSYIPFHGPNFGLVLKDADLVIGAILISGSSPNIQINCLSVPNTLLSLGHFKESLAHYRQIASSFTGRSEGKEAIFGAGISLLQEAQQKKDLSDREKLLEEALEEFNKFESKSPLEYLGKSLVYRAMQDLEEEVKCLELAVRRFKNHPLLSLVKDQILFRLYEASHKDRNATYAFALLSLMQIPEAFTKPDHRKLLPYLQNSSEPLPFLSKDPDYDTLPIQLAFWLAKHTSLVELFETSVDSHQKIHALYALFYLGHTDLALELLAKTPELIPLSRLEIVADFYEHGFMHTAQKHFPSAESLHSLPVRKALEFLLSRFYFTDRQTQEQMARTVEALCPYNLEEKAFLEKPLLEFLLYLGEIERADHYLQTLPLESHEFESSPFYFSKGCLIAAREGLDSAKKFFSRSNDEILPPRHCLIDFYLSADTKGRDLWLSRSFFYEKILLFIGLATLYKVAGLKKQYTKLEEQVITQMNNQNQLKVEL